MLVIMPSWVGDAVMATPALRLVRSHLPGSFIGALVRPGIDQVMAGTDFFDEVHIDRAAGVMGPKHAAAKVRPRRYDAALLLTNSFSTALIARIAGIPVRVGYSRDARGLLLTDRLEAPRRADGRWAPIPAVSYYWRAALALLGRLDRGGREGRGDAPSMPDPFALPLARMELGCTAEQEHAGVSLLTQLRVDPAAPMAILNPGGNNPAKRWPAERFAALGRALAERHGMTILVNGSPAEADLSAGIAQRIGARDGRGGGGGAADLAGAGITLGALKAIVRRCRLMVTNDTGPRHIAAAFGVPVVSLFGPTDPRWTTIPVDEGKEAVLVADPTLPESEIADDHPARCDVSRIAFEAVLEAAERLLGGAAGEGAGALPGRAGVDGPGAAGRPDRQP